MAEDTTVQKNLGTPTLERGLFGTAPEGEKTTFELFEEMDKAKTKDLKSNQVTPSDVKPSDSGGGEAEPPKKSIEEQVTELRKEVETVTKRYGDSSGEALALKTKLNKLEPLLPILEEMERNPELVQTMRAEIDRGSKPKSPMEALGLADDFVFDGDQAIKDPNSDSYRVLRYVAGVEADAKDKKRAAADRETAAIEKQEQDFTGFVKDSELSKEDTAAMRNYMSEHEVTYEDVLYLMKREDIGKAIAKAAQKETLKQIQKAQELSGTPLGTRESVLLDTSDDDVFFNNIFGDREGGLFPG